MNTAERVGVRLQVLRRQRQLSQKALGELIGSDGPRIHRIEKGRENPTLETLDKLAAALVVDVGDLFPRPEDGTGHGTSTEAVERNRLLDSRWAALVEAADGEMQAEDSWRGDVLKAIAVLGRALARGRDSEAHAPRKKAGP